MDIKIGECEVKGAIKTTVSDVSVGKVGKLDIEKTKTDKITTQIGGGTVEKHRTDFWTKTNVIVAIVVGIFTIVGIVWGICK